MKTFFSSDHHFLHRNIIKLCNRPYVDEHEMTEACVDAWNSKVNKSDTVYYLGDFSLSTSRIAVDEILKRLNGQKFLIKGNHDSKLVYKNSRWVKVSDYHELKIKDIPIVLSHYPFRSWNKQCYGSYMLHGHVHTVGSYMEPGNIMDVGVDLWGAPVTFEEIRSKKWCHKKD